MTGSPAVMHDRDEMFQKNVQLLPDYLQEQVQKIDLNELWSRIEIVYSREGYPICKIKKNGSVFHMNSIHPREQAKQWADQLPFDQIRTLFVYGSGFGYPLFELLDKLHNNNVVVVFEQSIDVFAAMLHCFDMEPIFRVNKFLFLVGNFEDFSPVLQDQISGNLIFFTAPSAVLTPYARMFKKEYMRIQDSMFEWLLIRFFTLELTHHYPLLQFKNIIDNIDEILNRPYLSSLKDKYKNVPAFIIANGPSLDKDILELKKIEGKGLILCCESAIITLMKNHIKPDAICVLDRRPKDYEYHFENRNYPDDISLLAFAAADPRIFQSFAGPQVPIFLKDEISQWMNRLIGDDSSLEGGLSVAHLAYQAAVYMGANPIVLVGQDLAYGPDGVTHSRQSIYSEEKLKHTVEKIKSDAEVSVESNDGKQIPTNSVWYHFKLTFEQMIEEHPEISVINTTENGAKIRGTQCVGLAKIIESFCREDLPYRLNLLIKESVKKVDVPARKREMKPFLTELTKYAAIYRALEKRIAERRGECEQLMHLSEEKNSVAESKLVQAYEQNTLELTRFLSPDFGYYFHPVIIWGGYRMSLLGTAKTSTKIRQALEIQYELFDYLTIVCHSLAVCFQSAKEKIAARGYETEG